MDELPVSDVDAAVGSGTGGEICILKEHQIPRLQFPEAHRRAVAQLIRGPVGQIHPELLIDVHGIAGAVKAAGRRPAIGVRHPLIGQGQRHQIRRRAGSRSGVAAAG